MNDPLAYRGRGRPRKPPGEKKTERLVISLRPEDQAAILKASGAAGFRRVQDWAIEQLLKAAGVEEP